MSDEQLREDELVSAYLDGEATPAEIAEVEGNDALLARVEELRTVRDAVAEPVTPLSADLRDDLIGAALQVADAEAATRLEAKVVPLQRPQRLLLAMAAAVVVLAAVVGTGLIASRGGDDSAETAADAPAMTGVEAAEPAAEMDMAAEEPMAEMDMAAADEAAEEEPMAEEAMVEALEAEAVLEAEADAALAEAAMAPTTTVAAAEAAPEATEAEEERRSESTADGGGRDDGTDTQVVDLGTLETLESLFENIGASWSAALEDGAMADPGSCSAEVHEQAFELSADAPRSFVATVGTEDPVTFDALFARRADGSAIIIYAASPGCEIGTHELIGS